MYPHRILEMQYKAFLLISLFIFIMSTVNSEESEMRWELHKVDFKKHPNAKCLDGSPGGYWFSKGHGSGSSKFLIHHQGGGWCDTFNECFVRATQSAAKLGSSKKWIDNPVCNSYHPSDKKAQPCHADGGSGGLFSFSSEINPVMYNWNKVYVGYCDGSSFSSRRPDSVPVVIGGKTIPGASLHFKGNYILEAIYDMLLVQNNMNTASEVVISGSSAGGLSVILHIDALRHKIHTRSKTKPFVTGVIDGGYFLDVPSIHGENRMHELYQNMYLNQNLTLNPFCIDNYLEAKPAGQGWKCMMPQYSLRFVKTPLFIIQSFTDAYQVSRIMDLDCMPGSSTRGKCNSHELRYLNQFRSSMLRSLEVSASSLSAYWLVSCTLHTIAHHDSSWNLLTASSRTLKDTFLGWYSALLNTTKGITYKKSDWEEVDTKFNRDSCHTIEDVEESDD